MPTLHLLHFDIWASIIEMGGSVIIVAYCLAALLTLLRLRAVGIVSARLLVAQGVLTGLSFELAGTLLKTLLLVSWRQILIFTAIFALRTLLKRLFVWEQTHLRHHATIS
ncbi:MAG: DUF1622 domain-containing protein [Chloroflexota bacterium]|nr:DUF1622 domain-containing protein [Chloroflexota bacterium]